MTGAASVPLTGATSVPLTGAVSVPLAINNKDHLALRKVAHTT